MTFYEGQGFVAQNDTGFKGGHSFLWALSGEGSLIGDNASGDGTRATGPVAYYKAPGYSPDKICKDYQATLTLYCDGNPVDTVHIEIRGVFPDPVPRAGTYWWATDMYETNCGDSRCPPNTCYWAYLSVNLIEVDCNGKHGPYTVIGYSAIACHCSTLPMCREARGSHFPCYTTVTDVYGKNGCCPSDIGVVGTCS